MDKAILSSYIIGLSDSQTGILWKHFGNPGLFSETKSHEIHTIYNTFVYEEGGAYAAIVTESHTIEDVRVVNHIATIGNKKIQQDKNAIAGLKTETTPIPIIGEKQLNYLQDNLTCVYQTVYTPLFIEPYNREHVVLDLPVIIPANEITFMNNYVDVVIQGLGGTIDGRRKEDTLTEKCVQWKNFMKQSYKELATKQHTNIDVVWIDREENNEKETAICGMVLHKRLSNIYQLFEDIGSFIMSTNKKDINSKQLMDKIYMTFEPLMFKKTIIENKKEGIHFPTEKLYPNYGLEELQEFLIDDIDGI